jgi:hypothetical protein
MKRKKKRALNSHLKKLNDKRDSIAAERDAGSSCGVCATKQKKPRVGGRKKGVTYEKRNTAELLADRSPFVDVASTPDPLTKKQRFEDSQHFSPDVIRSCSNQKRDPVRTHTEYFRSQELIEKRLDDLGKKLSVRDADFFQAIGKLNSHTGGKQIERMAHELSNFDLLATQADELILHVTKLERETAALHH